MSDTADDVYTRLGAAIEDWNFQIVQSHEALSNQIRAARSHLDHLVADKPAPESDDVALETSRTDAEFAALESQVADLAEQLEAATDRNSALESELAGAMASAEKDGEAGALAQAQAEAASARERCAVLEESLSQSEETLAAAQAETERAREQCRDLEAQLVEMTQRLDAAEGTPAESPNPEVIDALRAEADAARERCATLEQENGEALRRIAELEGALATERSESRGQNKHVEGGTVLIEAFDAQGHKKRMGEILMDLGVLNEEQLKAILKEQSADPQHRLGALVVEHGYTGEDIVAKILAAQLRLPYLDIQDLEIEARVLDLVSPHVSRLHRCLPLQEENGVLTAAMVNPLDLIAIEDLELASGCQVSPAVSTAAQIEARLDELYGPAE